MHVMIIQCCLLFTWLHTLNSVKAAAINVPEPTCYSGDGREYRGTVNKTSSGKTCQSWSAQTPHNHVRTPENYPCRGLDNNYCRNPDRMKKPWCYTTDSVERWEYCDVPSCDVAPGPASEPKIVPEMTCFTCDGINYRGTVAETISGKTCQLWTAQTPHKHISVTPEKHPHKGLDSNYCRNPDNERMPWCYTTDSETRWEYCQVPRCPLSSPPLLQLKVTDSPFCAKETRYVKTACLPNKRFPDGKKCVISGWGSTEHRSKSDKLLYVPIPLMSKEQCLEKLAKESGLLDDNMICAGDSSSGACAGDSGGPLTCKDDGVHYITGVVSWGSVECGGDGILPGVYTDVHRYVDWINQIIS